MLRAGIVLVAVLAAVAAPVAGQTAADSSAGPRLDGARLITGPDAQSMERFRLAPDPTGAPSDAARDASRRLGGPMPAGAATPPAPPQFLDRRGAKLMVVGGVAVVAGAIVGSGGGAALIIGGVSAGLWGLWLYLD